LEQSAGPSNPKIRLEFGSAFDFHIGASHSAHRTDAPYDKWHLSITWHSRQIGPRPRIRVRPSVVLHCLKRDLQLTDTRGLAAEPSSGFAGFGSTFDRSTANEMSSWILYRIGARAHRGCVVSRVSRNRGFVETSMRAGLLLAAIIIPQIYPNQRHGLFSIQCAPHAVIWREIWSFGGFWK
jgi:hypothetical protein